VIAATTTASRIKGSVRIVGAGLLGTSIGLALMKKGVTVVIDDVSPANQKLAIDYGAGAIASPLDEPSMIIVCVPPDVTARTVAAELKAHPSAVVTDVASVKAEILEQLSLFGSSLKNYVGSHPMAGRERGGAIAGRADLFVGRPWVVSPHSDSSRQAVQSVEDLAIELGAFPSVFSAEDHDRAVAMVSHLPQLVSSLLASQLNLAVANDLSLAGQGLRDTTRIAASDPKLWIQILEANAPSLSALLRNFLAEANQVLVALEQPGAPGALTAIGNVLEQGNRGVNRIPGKHGSNPTQYSQLVVMIDDKPGELARLLTEIGLIGVNLEDLKLEHSPGAPIGLVEVFVLPEMELKLSQDLIARGWRIAG
jgi:prephenate dehydrogenase